MSSRPTWNSRSDRSVEQLADVRPAAIVGHGGQHAGHLVQRRGRPDSSRSTTRLPSTCTTASLGVDARAHLAHHDAVDLDPAGPDQLLGLAPGRDARRGQHLLQPDALGPHRRSWSGPGRPTGSSSASSTASMSGSSGPSDGQVREIREAQPVEEQLGGPVEDAAGVRVGAVLGDQAPRRQRADHAVDVDAANGRDPRARDRLPVRDDGQRLQCRLRQPTGRRRPARSARRPARTGPGCRTASRRRRTRSSIPDAAAVYRAASARSSSCTRSVGWPTAAASADSATGASTTSKHGLQRADQVVIGHRPSDRQRVRRVVSPVLLDVAEHGRAAVVGPRADGATPSSARSTCPGVRPGRRRRRTPGTGAATQGSARRCEACRRSRRPARRMWPRRAPAAGRAPPRCARPPTPAAAWMWSRLNGRRRRRREHLRRQSRRTAAADMPMRTSGSSPR